VDLICLNGPTGAIDLTMNGGTPGYSYLWSNGETTQDIDSLASGDYSVTVIDNLGCIFNTTLTVEDPIDPMLVNPTVTNVSCFGGSDAETEGVWKWVTGPEAGENMNYTNWNTINGEPNDYGPAVGS
jgi:hypothetical protein